MDERLDSPEEQLGRRRCEGRSMKRRTQELLLAYALWLPGLFIYVGSLELPWLVLDQGTRIPIKRTGAHPPSPFGRDAVVITGEDSFSFLLERLAGGSFVWLAHPLLYVGWLFLVCRRWRAATVAGCLAFVLALHAPFVFQPREGPWFPVGLGYYLWFASMALLACSAFLHNCFFHGDPIADNESVRRLAAQQRTCAADLAVVKHQVAELVDHQAATFLEEMEARSTSECSDY
jgi:hypothetical protein